MNSNKKPLSESRKLLLKEYFLNACLIAMIKETGAESARLQCELEEVRRQRREQQASRTAPALREEREPVECF